MLRIRLRQPCRQDVAQIGFREWFGKVVVEAGGNAGIAVAGERIRRERDHRHLCGYRERTKGTTAVADVPQCLESIHFGHLAVHQHHIEAVVGEHFKRLPAVFRELEFAPELLQHHRRDFAVDRIVLDHQRAAGKCASASRGACRDTGRHPQRFGDRAAQFSLADRLLQVDFDTGGARTRLFPRSGKGGQHQHSGRSEPRVGANPFRQFDAAHARHLHVDQGGFERRAGAGGRLHFLKRALARFGSVAGHVPVLHLMQQDAAIGRIVFDHQHTLLRQAMPVRLAARRRSRRGPGRANLEVKRKCENRTLARCAVDLDQSAHHLHQLLADGKAESGAAITARGCGAALLEYLEQALLRFLRYADAGVPHRYADARVSGRGGVRVDAHRYLHLAFLGELDGVADQVDQYLAQPPRVARDACRHRRCKVMDQLDASLVRTGRQKLGDFLDQLHQRELLDLKFESAGFDPGKVEDIVDDVEQGLAGAVHRLREAALTIRQPGSEQKLGHAEHAIHGRADFVTHVRKKLRLRPIRAFGLFLGRQKRFLLRTVQGDVLAQAVDPDLAIRHAHGLGLNRQPAQTA